MALFHDHADVSVRPALPGDEVAVVAVQLRAWQSGLAAAVPDLLERVDALAMTTRWAEAITAPPTPGHRVLVALDGARVVGVAAVVPVPQGVEVVTLEVDPDHRRGGHGSRLLAACVDLGRLDGADHVLTWGLDHDAAREQFLAAAGLGRDGAARVLAEGATEAESLVERRWVAAI